MVAKKKAPAKRGASRYQAAPRKPVPGLVWLVCGVVIGGFVVMLMNLEPGGDEVKRERTEVKRSAPKAATGSEQPKPKYDFYTLLPESEVIVPPDAMPEPAPPTLPEQKPVSPEEAARIDTQRAEAALAGLTPPPPPLVASAGQTQYFLQAGSFRQRSEADRVRAQIILMGLDARLEDAKLANGEVWHRVQVGPFADQSRLTQAEQTLSGNGFTNLLRQQRSIR